MPLESILGPTVTAWIAHVVAGLTAFALLYGGAKILWTRLTGRPFPVNRFTRALDALAELGTNILGFVNKLTRGNGQPLLANPDVQRRDALIAEMSTALDDMRRRLGDAPLSTANLAAKAGAVAVSETRGFVAVPPTDLAVMGGAKFDPTATITVTPEISAAVRAIDDQRGQRGFASLRALLAVVVLFAVVGVVATGCPVVREVSLRAARAPSPGDCRPGTMRCLSTPDGVVPVRCAETPALDGRHREWPALPRDGYGDQRYCAWGCIVEDGGTLAHCTGRDGGL